MTATAQQQTGQTTTIAALRNPAAALPDVSAGFGSLKSFELMQRMAALLCASTLVPVQYRAVVQKLDRYGNVKEQKENPNALANAVVALNMAQRMGADPLMIMQNLYVIEGRPSWSSQFIIAAINGCGKFSPLRFNLQNLGAKSAEYQETFWENNQRQNRAVVVDIEDVECIAWAIEKETGERIEGPPITISMAVAEGWYTKNGSKWQTMAPVMLRYRAASFFGKLYAPELLMGLKTVEEELDIIEVAPSTGEVMSVTTETLRADMKRAEVVPTDEQGGKPPEANPEPPKKAQATPQAPPAETKKAAEKAPPKTPPTPPAPGADLPGKLAEAVNQEPPHPAADLEPQAQAQDDAPQISDVVAKYMREINQASSGGSFSVDTWRMKHIGRVLKDCGGDQNNADFVHIRDYAQMVYDECKRAEDGAVA